MELEQAIHERWASDHQLTALVPAERFVTGRAEGLDQLPYVILQIPQRRTQINTTRSAIEETRVEFDVRTASHQEATKILEQLRRRFHRQSFPLVEGNCLVMQHDLDRWTAEEDGVWCAVAAYTMLNHRSLK